MAAVLDAVRTHAAPETGYAFNVERERSGDVEARERLLDAAMGPNRKRKSSEAIRRGRLPADGLALVARDVQGDVVGTVRLWNIHAGHGVPALLLGPLAVDSRHEGRGIGGALMRAAIDEAQALDHGAILLVGDPEYYRRFGFTADRTGALSMPGPFERHRLLGLELRKGWLDRVAGIIRPSGRRIGTATASEAA